MVSRPYVPESVKSSASRQHAIVRRLGAQALTNPALPHIMDAADEVAAVHGKTSDQLTDEEADRAIALGTQRHRAR
jgi:hypothetical protein